MEATEGSRVGFQNFCEVLVVRHGLTDYNAERRLQGQLDVPLNDIGRDQCKSCGSRLKRMVEDGQHNGIDAIYASPLERTRESAEIIRAAAGIQCDIVLDERIQEWNAGILQGHLLDELSVMFPKAWEAWNRSRDPGFVFPGGESFQQRFDRVKAFFLEVVKRHAGQRILVVTHGGVLDDLFRLVRGIPMNIKTNAPKVNAEIHTVRAHVRSRMMNACTSEDMSSGTLSPTSTSSPSNSPETPQITWEIIMWGKLSRTDQLLTGKIGNTPIDISVRNIEYA